MKIGILTFHCSHNYGAMLQAYATQTFLKNKTKENVKIIDYKPMSSVNAYKILKTPKSLKQIIKFCIQLVQYRKLKKRWDAFEKFYDDMFDKTQRYFSYEELKQNPPDCDVVISGSDQVFNPKNKNTEVYYLDFLKNSDKRLATYAPSFGYTTIPEDKKEMIQASLNRIDFLSSREFEGCSIIKELTGRTVDCVLDPVFLLQPEEWRGAMVSSFKKPLSSYILVYALVGYKKQMAIAHKIKKYLKLPIVLVSGGGNTPFSTADKIIYGTGPKEFVQLFANADYVVTDSFHGTAFSIIFNKPFFSIIVLPRAASRITSLLERIDLNERTMFDVRELAKAELEVDFRKPNQLLQKERMDSIKYLKRSISMS